MTPGRGVGNFWAYITGSVEGEMAFQAEFKDMVADVNIGNNDSGALTGHFNTLDLGTINPSTFKTSLPGVTAASLKTQLQLLLTAWETQANIDLAAGYVIPEVFGVTGIVEIDVKKGYVEVGVDATPATFLQIRELLRGIKQNGEYMLKAKKMAAINQQF